MKQRTTYETRTTGSQAQVSYWDGSGSTLTRAAVCMGVRRRGCEQVHGLIIGPESGLEQVCVWALLDNQKSISMP